jgi:hypothetical protein
MSPFTIEIFQGISKVFYFDSSFYYCYSSIIKYICCLTNLTNPYQHNRKKQFKYLVFSF